MGIAPVTRDCPSQCAGAGITVTEVIVMVEQNSGGMKLYARSSFVTISYENHCLSDTILELLHFNQSVMMNAAAPEGAPPRRINE